MLVSEFFRPCGTHIVAIFISFRLKLQLIKTHHTHTVLQLRNDCCTVSVGTRHIQRLSFCNDCYTSDFTTTVAQPFETPALITAPITLPRMPPTLCHSYVGQLPQPLMLGYTIGYFPPVCKRNIFSSLDHMTSSHMLIEIPIHCPYDMSTVRYVGKSEQTVRRTHQRTVRDPPPPYKCHITYHYLHIHSV